MRDLVKSVDHLETHACIAAERRLLEGLAGTCRSPIAALATMDDGQIFLRAEILTGDGSECRQGSARFDPHDSRAPAELAKRLLDEASAALRALFGG